jgi:hypothetical protein
MNPLQTYAEFMEHPKPPMHKEHAAEIAKMIEEGTDLEHLIAVRAIQHQDRDRLHPGWRDQYNAELKLWLMANGQQVDDSAFRQWAEQNA